MLRMSCLGEKQKQEKNEIKVFEFQILEKSKHQLRLMW